MAYRIEYVVSVFVEHNDGTTRTMSHQYKGCGDAIAAARMASHGNNYFENIRDRNCTAASYRNETGTLSVSVNKLRITK